MNNAKPTTPLLLSRADPGPGYPPPPGAVRVPLWKIVGGSNRHPRTSDDYRLVGYALIDEEDAYLTQREWFVHRSKHKGREKAPYVRHRERTDDGYREIYLHRIVLGLPPWKDDPMRREVDHRNHDTLDNRESNLRAVSRAENGANRAGDGAGSTTRHRNVVWLPARGRYQVYVRRRGKDHYGGYFARLEDAVAAAEALRRRVFPFLYESTAPAPYEARR